MQVKKVLNLLIYISIILTIIIIILFTMGLFNDDSNLHSPITPPPPPGDSAPGRGGILLKKLDENITDEFLEINESFLEQNQLLADVFRAWENPEDYENAEKHNNTLVFNTNSSASFNLSHFMEDKWLQKYQTDAGAIFNLYYDDQFFHLMVFVE